MDFFRLNSKLWVILSGRWMEKSISGEKGACQEAGFLIGLIRGKGQLPFFFLQEEGTDWTGGEVHH